MQPFILIKKLFLTAIEEIKRISGIECPYMNAVVNVGGMAARGPPLLKKRKKASQSSGNGFSNEK